MNGTLKAGIGLIFSSFVVFVYWVATREQPANGDGVGLVYEVEFDGKSHFLAGSFHLLRKGDYPIPVSYSLAYSGSDELVFEVEDGSKGESGRAADQLFNAGKLPGDARLSDVVPEELKQRLTEALRELGLADESVDRYRPWLAALTLASAKQSSLGVLPEYGLERYFRGLCERDGKPMSGVEGIDEQVDTFANLSEEESIELLRHALDELSVSDERALGVVRAWRRGDLEFVVQHLEEGRWQNQAFYERMIDSRNREWVRRLIPRMRGDRRLMILVGAGHLGGDAGLIALFEESGAVVRQVRPEQK